MEIEHGRLEKKVMYVRGKDGFAQVSMFKLQCCMHSLYFSQSHIQKIPPIPATVPQLASYTMAARAERDSNRCTPKVTMAGMTRHMFV